jgi:hypothetical protein
MTKPRKKPAAPEPPPMPRVGEKVTIPHAVSVLEVTHVSRDGDEVNLQRPGTNLEWFRVRTDNLTFVERKTPARTSNPFTNPEPVLDTGEILERIATVKEENLKRLDDDVDILKAYLNAARAQDRDRGARGPDCRAARELEESRGANQEAAEGID